MRKFLLFLFIFFAIGVGLYPALYVLLDMTQGLLATKPADILENGIWQKVFYFHIGFGAISLLSGWSQFLPKFRVRYLNFHRLLGKVYVAAVLISGLAGLYLAVFATGGIIAILGFTGLAISWLFTTAMAYFSIRQGKVRKHENWMIRSYAVTFAAVTLRIMLPTFPGLLGLAFIPSYQIISWACWIPNLFVAEWIIKKYNSREVAVRAG